MYWIIIILIIIYDDLFLFSIGARDGDICVILVALLLCISGLKVTSESSDVYMQMQLYNLWT